MPTETDGRANGRRRQSSSFPRFVSFNFSGGNPRGKERRRLSGGNLATAHRKLRGGGGGENKSWLSGLRLRACLEIARGAIILQRALPFERGRGYATSEIRHPKGRGEAGPHSRVTTPTRGRGGTVPWMAYQDSMNHPDAGHFSRRRRAQGTSVPIIGASPKRGRCLLTDWYGRWHAQLTLCLSVKFQVSQRKIVIYKSLWLKVQRFGFLIRKRNLCFWPEFASSGSVSSWGEGLAYLGIGVLLEEALEPAEADLAVLLAGAAQLEHGRQLRLVRHRHH